MKHYSAWFLPRNFTSLVIKVTLSILKRIFRLLAKDFFLVYLCVSVYMPYFFLWFSKQIFADFVTLIAALLSLSFSLHTMFMLFIKNELKRLEQYFQFLRFFHRIGQRNKMWSCIVPCEQNRN